MSSSYAFLTRPLAVCATALTFAGAAQADILHYDIAALSQYTDTAAITVSGVSKGTVQLTNFLMYDSIGATTTSSVQNQNKSYWQSFVGFCFDINQPINASAYGWQASQGTTNITNGVDFTKNLFTAAGYSGVSSTVITRVNRLFDLYYGSAVANSGTRTADTIAGFQLAIWALEYGNSTTISYTSGSNSITVGNFSATSIAPVGAATAANTYLSGVFGAAAASTHYVLNLFTNGTYQDVIGVALPEPGTDLLAALGLIGLVAARRRRKV